jgi:hypothetical protein
MVFDRVYGASVFQTVTWIRIDVANNKPVEHISRLDKAQLV